MVARQIFSRRTNEDVHVLASGPLYRHPVSYNGERRRSRMAHSQIEYLTCLAGIKYNCRDSGSSLSLPRSRTPQYQPTLRQHERIRTFGNLAIELVPNGLLRRSLRHTTHFRVVAVSDPS